MGFSKAKFSLELGVEFCHVLAGDPRSLLLPEQQREASGNRPHTSAFPVQCGTGSASAEPRGCSGHRNGMEMSLE